ncbi:MAG: hypothetical protein WCB12_13005 [Bryobacteraceae bacterium]
MALNRSVDSLKNEIRGNIADMERQKAALPAGRSDSEMNRFQIDSHIADAQREISALDAYERGVEIWPNEQGPRT